MLPPKIKTPLLASITETRGDFQLSVPTLISRPFLPFARNSLSSLFLLSPSLSLTPFPLTHSLPSPSLPLTTYLCLPFPLHPFPLPLPSLPSHSLSPSLHSSILPCPLSLSPCLTSLIFLLQLSSFLPLSLPQAFSRKVTTQQSECDTILADSQNLLQLTHPKAVSVLPAKDLEQR